MVRAAPRGGRCRHGSGVSIQAVGWVLEHERTTSLAERLVLISLANHVSQEGIDKPWEAWPGIDLIAQEAGLARRQTVKDALARLKAKGLISVTVQGAPDRRIRHDRRPNLYTIHHDGSTADGTPSGETGGTPDEPPKAEDGGTPDRVTGARRSAPRGHASRVNGGTANEPQSSTEPAVEPAVEPTLGLVLDDGTVAPRPVDRFPEFWTTYPKDRRVAKGGAQKAWAKAIKRATPDEILDGLRRFVEETNTWATGDRGFIPTPPPWLNKDRWADTPGANLRSGPQGAPRRSQAITDNRTGTARRLSPDEV